MPGKDTETLQQYELTEIEALSVAILCRNAVDQGWFKGGNMHDYLASAEQRLDDQLETAESVDR